VTRAGRGDWRNAARRCSSTLLVVASAWLFGSCGAGGEGDSESTNATSATLAWDPVVAPSPAGYRVYYGTSTGTYLQSYGNGLDAGNVTTYSVTGLSGGTRYYFVVTVYDTMGNESNYSNEVFTDIP
jgi:Fibronectin type III domain